ncbi:putative ribonuclease H-like domain-containing protein [Tanacetum coccineum]
MERSSKNLTKILNSQMSTHDKNGSGFGTQMDDLSNKSETDSENSLTIFEGNPLYPRADISCNINEATIVKPKSINETIVSKSKINRNEVIIKDWTSDDEDDVCAVKTVSSVEPNVTQAVRSQADKSGQTLQKQGIDFKKIHKIKACFVCKSTDHLIKDGDFYKSPEHRVKSVVNTGERVVKPVGDYGKRPIRHVYTVRPVSTAKPLASKIAQSNSVIRQYHPRLDIIGPKASNSPIKRSYFTQPVYRYKDLKLDVKTFGVNNMTTVGTKAVVSKGKVENVLKKAKWGNPEILLQDHAVVDSGCSSHMTGNKAYLSVYEDFNGGFMAFGSDPKEGKITGKGKIKTANLDFDDVYFVDELKFNLFSISQMCDKKNSILFTESKCLILSPSFKLLDESQVVLRAPRKDDVYSLDLKNIVPSGGITCLYANATTDESKLWHRRLGHVNFKNINKLVKGHLVIGLSSKVFVNNHTCVACKKGKQHKASCKAKLDRIIRKPLELLHMDLFGLVSIESINKKRYCLVVTDDFSRFSWVFFLATKDETSEILCNLIIGLEKQLNHNVKIIRCDNGTEFKNYVMNELCAKKGIKREFSIARTPQQNGVAERKNRTLIEAARTMYLLGYSTSSKAFRVYSKRTKRVEENLHINFLEDQPNVAGTGTQDSYVAGQHQMPEDEQVWQDKLEMVVTKELVTNAMNDESRQAFKEEKMIIASQNKAAQATSINQLSTDRPFVSTDRSFVSTDRQNIIDVSTLPNADLPIDLNMLDLEDASDTLPNDGIFNEAYDNDEDVGAVADFHNMDNTIAGVSKEKSTDKGKRYRRRARSVAKNINIGLDAEEEINTGVEKVNTSSTKVDSGTPSKRGQREGKAPMIEEDIHATHKTKEQIRQEEAGLKEAIKLQAQLDEEVAKQIHLDKMVAKRIAEEEALSEQQKKRKAQVQFEAQFYIEEDWDAIKAKLEANAKLTKDVLGKDLPE